MDLELEVPKVLALQENQSFTTRNLRRVKMDAVNTTHLRRAKSTRHKMNNFLSFTVCFPYMPLFLFQSRRAKFARLKLFIRAAKI